MIENQLKRFPREAYAQPRGPEWLRFVWAVNDKAKQCGEEPIFGLPTKSGPWWAGGHVEEYPEARIVHQEDSVRIVPKTERAAALFDTVGYPG